MTDTTTETAPAANPTNPAIQPQSSATVSADAAPTSEPATSGATTAMTDARASRHAKLAYLENAMNLVLKDLEAEGVAAYHGIENEVKGLKSFLTYQFQTLKGKL